MVHGVGRHDRLSSLLEVYQAIRADLTSPEAPALNEDRIPDWSLDGFQEGADPPFLKLRYKYRGSPGDTGVLYLYEVNYSHLAGVVRANHKLDLTTLFVGLDAAVCAARQQWPAGQRSSVFPGDPAVLAALAQRVTGVLTAATGPLLGVPSLLLSRYSRSFLAAFTRFFEDVATYALDKNGEQLISEHLEQVVRNIRGSPHFAPAPGIVHEFVMAGHSLGSVVTHSYLVRHWSDPARPDAVITFGSPIGLITWLWLFLDFAGLDFARWREVETYFCWTPSRTAGGPWRPLRWLNIANRLDPIATVFPDAVADLSRDPAQLRRDLDGGGITHRYCGPARFWSTGRAHTAYLQDRNGFLEILQRATGLHRGSVGDEDVEAHGRQAHWEGTSRVLRRVQWASWAAAVACAVIYCGLVAAYLGQPWIAALAALFAVPPVTIGALAFVQRLCFGGRTKRVTTRLLGSLRVDRVALPYLLRHALAVVGARVSGRTIDDREAPPHHPVRHFLVKVVAFLPTLAALSLPFVAGLWWRDPGVALPEWPATIWLVGFAAFVLILVFSAAHQLVTTWRRVLAALDLAP
jgi:hypothetical protein